jgi:rhodanese-related sulfurtransferase
VWSVKERVDQGPTITLPHENGVPALWVSAGTVPNMSSDTPEIEVDDALTAVEAGAFLLDVRERDEWDAGHAPGAVHIPMGEVVARTGELPADCQIVAICRAGSRSRAVTDALVQAGYDAVNTIGGMNAWQAFGYDVVTDAGAPGTVI